MPKLAANLSMLFNEVPFLDRLGAAAAAGFKGVEYLFPYEHSPETIASRLEEHGLTNVLFNLPPGDWSAGERGVAALPGRETEFAEGLEQALHYARALGCERLHAMAGIPGPGVDPAACRETYVANLRRAADAAAADGITILIEPLNRRDNPGYFLTTQADAAAILAEVGAPNLRIQFDFYHCQIVEGDLEMRLRERLDLIGHVQIAGVPGRNEPNTGEVNYSYLLDLLDALGYGGWVGCEYRPAVDTGVGLGWARPYL